jgi:flagellar biosynthesis/type III secretory pathway protein FliH
MDEIMQKAQQAYEEWARENNEQDIPDAVRKLWEIGFSEGYLFAWEDIANTEDVSKYFD